jgi:hypothetical protein
MDILYYVLIALAALIIAFLVASKKGVKFGKKKGESQAPSSNNDAA